MITLFSNSEPHRNTCPRTRLIHVPKRQSPICFFLSCLASVSLAIRVRVIFTDRIQCHGPILKHRALIVAQKPPLIHTLYRFQQPREGFMTRPERCNILTERTYFTETFFSFFLSDTNESLCSEGFHFLVDYSFNAPGIGKERCHYQRQCKFLLHMIRNTALESKQRSGQHLADLCEENVLG